MIGATVRAEYPLRLPSSGSTRTGTRCAAIPLSKNSATKNSREPARFGLTVDSEGRTMWIVDAHRGDGQRFVASFILDNSPPPELFKDLGLQVT